MRDLLIHKPEGKTISDSVCADLKRKYFGFWQYTVKRNIEIDGKQKVRWDIPKKLTFKGEIDNCTDPFAEDVESVIHLSTVNSSKDKGTFFFFPSGEREIENKDEWVMGFISCDGKCIDDSYHAGSQVKMEYSVRCEQKILSELVLKNLSNSSILNVMRFLAKDSGLESVIISNGIVNSFLTKSFKEDGVKFSNLEYSNDLPEKKLEAITTILAWKKFEENPDLDIKKEIENLKSEPHRFLKALFEKIKGSKFLELFS